MELGQPESNLATQALVRVDGEEYGPFDIAADVPSIDLPEGAHVVGVDFLDDANQVVGSYAPIVVEIEAGQTERVSVGTQNPSAPTGHFEVSDTIFELTEIKLVPVDQAGTILRRTEGKGTTEFGLLTFRDGAGNPTGVLRISAEYIVRDARWELDPQESVFKGNESGTFIMYLGAIAEENVIFEGDFLTNPPDNLRAVIQPDGTLTRFELRVFVEAEGRGVYRNHLLRGTAQVECFRAPTGDACFIRMQADIL